MKDTILAALGVFGAGMLFLLGMTALAYLVRRGGKWLNREDNTREMTPAAVIAKREHIGRDNENQPYTQYYITFQLASGERIELRASDDVYGMTIEGDTGLLAWQGKELLAFDRTAGE